MAPGTMDWLKVSAVGVERYQRFGDIKEAGAAELVDSLDGWEPERRNCLGFLLAIYQDTETAKEEVGIGGRVGRRGIRRGVSLRKKT